MVKLYVLPFVAATTLVLLALWGPIARPPLLAPGSAGTTVPLRHSREAEECHRVKRLPGRGKLGDLRLFSGTVPVSEDRALFYAMVEAEKRPEEAPVVLWLTGGPGCSSVGTAFLGEHGPYFMSPGSSRRLIRNHWSWHTLPANVIYLDAPAFVGFSYSNSSTDREAGDNATTADILSFLKGWQSLFPRLRDNPFWLAGESYAGHYVPNLAFKLLQHSRPSHAEAGPGPKDYASRALRLDFRGFMLGNPSTDPEYDNKGRQGGSREQRLTYWHSHGLISEDIRREIEDTCDFKEVIITPTIEVETRKEDEKCKKAVQDAISEMGSIDIQNVIGDQCKRDSKAASSRQGGLPTLLSMLRGKRRRHEEVDPCISQEVEAYLGRRDVQDALHANMTGLLNWTYKGCTEGEIFKYSADDQLESQLPLYRKLMEQAPELRVLIYTGDADGMVPLTGTRKWVFELGTEEGKKKKVHWKHWEDTDGQVGGYLEEYQDFTFLTIRSAGHEAPYTARERTYMVYKKWLRGEDIVPTAATSTA